MSGGRVVQRLGPRLAGAEEPAPAPRWLVGLGAGIGLVLMVATATRFRAIQVERDSWPVDAFHYLARNRLSGKLVVPFNGAQYAIFVFHPDILVSFDGRYGTVYSNEILDMN